MTGVSLTPQEYELHLKDLRERLHSYLKGGGENVDRLLRDAESVLELAETYPHVFERYREVEGLVAEVLARRRQQKFLAQPSAPAEAPGCLLGWLSGRRPRSTP